MKKIFSCVFLLAGLFCTSVFGQEESLIPSGWSFNLVSDFVYYPKTEYVSGPTHFSPIVGAFDNFQVRERFHGVYTKATPLGTNPFFQYANLSVDLGLELTPIDVAPMLSVTFMPHPLMYFSAGGMFGIGWPIFGMDSVSVLNADSKEWIGLKPFVNNYYEMFASANFQFDFGAIFPGEWTHVIMTASYKVIYKGLTGMGEGDIWSWQGEPNMTNGFQYFQNYMIGYHFPKGVNFLGVITNVYGYYDKDTFGQRFAAYDSDFVKVDIDPVIEFQFGHETIDVLADFSSRRSFSQGHTSMKEELFLECIGREWYLRSIIVSWKHKF